MSKQCDMTATKDETPPPLPPTKIQRLNLEKWRFQFMLFSKLDS